MPQESKFLDKSARVVLVDPSGAVRQLLSEVTKAVGFANAQAVTSIQDAHTILETEGVDWLIVPLSADQEVNGLHTLRMMISFPELKDVRVSLLLDETESWCLPKAFEYGMLSYHTKPFTKDSLTKDLQEFLAIFEANNWNSTRTSAEYLRKYLRTANLGQDLLQLEQSMLDLFPGNARQLLNLAHAQQMNGQTDSAKSSLKQASFIDPALAIDIDSKANELFGSTDLTVQNATGGNVLGIDRVIIIDLDDATRAATKAIFEELGVTAIEEFSDGEVAWAAIDANTEPSLIVMEWRIPNLTGPLLTQRIRSKGFLKVPIIIQSSLLKPMDMPIIREMGIANLVQKPVEREAFLKAVIWTIQQDRMPTEQQTLENKIRACFAAKDMVEAENLIARYISDTSIAASRKNVIRAEFAFAKEQYELARDYAIESLKGGTESIFALNVLGKSLMILRQFEASLKCFQKAQNLSPVNLERLIVMAETQAEIGDTAAASETVAKAKDIDPDSKTVQEGEVRVAMASGSPEAARKIMSKLESINNVIGYLNNKAVAHAKCGFMEEGIELYQKTLESVPDDKQDIKSIVTYNMVLAKIRKNDLADALVDLEAMIAIPGNRVKKKAESLRDRLKAALASNSSMTLREGDQGSQQSANPESPVDDAKEADGNTLSAAVVQTTAGDLCCYLVYKTTVEDTDQMKTLMATAPKFKARKAIEKRESFDKAS